MDHMNEFGSKDGHLSRRGFVKSGLLGGFAAAVLPASTFAEKTDALPLPQFESEPFELEEITISELADGMASGKYTARSIAEKYLARIEAIDRQGPTLRSVIELNPDALSIADALDKERKEKGVTRFASWYPGIDQRQYRHSRSDGNHRRLIGTGRCKAAERFISCATTCEMQEQ